MNEVPLYKDGVTSFSLSGKLLEHHEQDVASIGLTETWAYARLMPSGAQWG